MNCPNCGFMNGDSSKFCINCGNDLSSIINQQSNILNNNQTMLNNNVNLETQYQNMNNQNNMNNQVNNNFVNPTQMSNQGIVNSNVNSANKIAFTQFFFIILAFLIKPVTAFKEEISKFSEMSNAIILSLIVAGVSSIANIVNIILSVVYVKKTSWYSGTTVEWVWENMKEINYIEAIGKNFLIYFVGILGIAAIYYVGCIILKKESNYPRLASIVALSIIPFTICSGMIAPILNIVYNPLSVVISIIAGVYTFILFHETINHEIKLEGNIKYYFNTICYSALLIALYFFVIKTLTDSISSFI